MLGETFFRWVSRLAVAATYEEVLDSLFDGLFAEVIDAEGIGLTETDRTGTVVATHGQVGDGFKLEGCAAEFAAGTICLHAHRAEPFTEELDERFRVAMALVCAHLRRICADLYEKRVRERLVLVRRESQFAAFIVHGRAVVPYNAAAVAYCDAYWGPDDTERMLSAEQAKHFWNKVNASWRNPVDPQWTLVTLDLGGGDLDIPVLGRHDGGAVLLFTPPPREAPQVDLPMLTRRQRDIMEWISEGKTSAETAIILNISPRTVEKHLEAVFQRFGVENRVAAVRTYLDLKNGLDPRLPFS
jgi:DNA-binding CsgD family transcriptional regulator